MHRRSFLKGSAAGLGGLALAGPLQAFAAQAAGASPLTGAGYGPLSPVASLTDGVQYLSLPPGFSYYAFSPVGGSMVGGGTVPAAHDGMACYAGQNGKLLLVRNHEQGSTASTAFVPAAQAWDPLADGGCTILEFDPANPPANIDAVPTWPAISGTVRNCAGGPTPWGSWLTCEETTAINATNGKRHGYVFDVPSSTPAGAPVTAVPLVAMGRFSHEAVAIDPSNNYAYETEDANPGGFYRFVPSNPQNYAAGGTLEVLAITGQPGYDTRTGETVGAALPVSWVPVANPDPGSGDPSCYAQGAALGAAIFTRPEGAWWSAQDNVVYFATTDGGAASAGQIWAYSPSASTLTLVYESPSTATLLKPDNITVSPTGNVWICEDTDRARQTSIKGLADDGSLFEFAQNIRPGTIGSVPATYDEFAGACFSPDGRWMFVSIQTPGVTFAITGPFSDTEPEPVVPEVAVPALLGLTAAAAMGGALYMRNRRDDVRTATLES